MYADDTVILSFTSNTMKLMLNSDVQCMKSELRHFDWISGFLIKSICDKRIIMNRDMSHTIVECLGLRSWNWSWNWCGVEILHTCQ